MRTMAHLFPAAHSHRFVISMALMRAWLGRIRNRRCVRSGHGRGRAGDINGDGESVARRIRSM